MGEAKEHTISVQYLGLVNNVLGLDEEEYCLPAGATVRTLLDMIRARHGEPFRACVFKSDGQLRPVVALYLNSRPVQSQAELDWPLGNETRVSVIVGVQPDPGG